MATNVLTSRQQVQNAAGLWVPVGMANPAPSLIRDPRTSQSSRISSFGALHAVPVVGLINSTFFSSAALTSNYTLTNAGTGATTVTANDGFFVMTTGATASSSAQITSIDTATYNGLGPMLFLNGLRLGQAGVAGVIRRWGVYDATNGYFFEDRDGVLGVVARKNAVDTRVASASFNGTVTASDTNGHIWEIEVTGGAARFQMDGVLLHAITPAAGTTTTSGSLGPLPIRVEALNGTNAAAYTIEGRGQNIARIGSLDSKRLNETLLDIQDGEVSRAVTTVRTGADLYASASGTVVGTKTVLDVNLAASAGGVAAVTGTLAAANGVVAANVATAGNATVYLYGGTYTALTLAFEVSPDNTNWFAIDATRMDGTGADIQPSYTAAALRSWNLPLSGANWFRVRAVAITQTVAPTIYIGQGPFLYEPSPVTRDFLSGSGVRTPFTASVAVAPTTAEALVTLVPVRSGTAAAGATSLTVTAGRTLRIQSIAMSIRNNAAIAAAAECRLRYANGGAVTATSAIAETLGAGVANALANGSASANVSVGDGIEYPSGYQFGISLVGVATGIATIVIKGYEFL